MPGPSQYFQDLEDPRSGNAKLHLFPEIMVIALLCVLCGGETAVDMADFADAKEDVLRDYLELPHGPPSHDTFSRIFQALDPDAFGAFFIKFVADFRARRDAFTQENAIAVDGKYLRRSFDHAAEKSALNMVSAWGHETGLTLGCVGAAGKGGSEIHAVRSLIALLDIKNQWITADALHCQRETAKLILDKGGDYCIACKGNQATLQEDLKVFIQDPETVITDSFEETDKDHGRLENRIVRTYSDIGWLNESHNWPGLKAIACVTATRDDKPSQTRIFLLSRLVDAKSTARLIRGHWGVENRLHWVLDVSMDEDAHRARKNNAPANFAILRRQALNVIKADTSKGSNRIKFKRAGWSDKFLQELVEQI